MPLVKGLGQLQGAFGAEAEPPIGLALEGGEVVEQRRGLRGGLALLMDRAGPAFAPGLDFRGADGIPQALGFGVLVLRFLEIFVKPLAGVGSRGHAEFAVDFEIGPGFEVADLFLALDENGEGGGLDAADRGDLETAEEFLVEGGHGPRAVDADEPVAFRPAGGGLGERDHFRVAAQVGKALADRVGRHRIQPEPFDRFFVFEMLDDVLKNQLALASGVAGVDDLADILAGQEFFQDAELVLGFFARDEVEVGRQDGQVFEAPFAADHTVFFRFLDLEKMAHGVRDHHAVAFVEALLPLEFSVAAFEGAREVAGDAGFLRDDEGFGHL